MARHSRFVFANVSLHVCSPSGLASWQGRRWCFAARGRRRRVTTCVAGAELLGERGAAGQGRAAGPSRERRLRFCRRAGPEGRHRRSRGPGRHHAHLVHDQPVLHDVWRLAPRAGPRRVDPHLLGRPRAARRRGAAFRLFRAAAGQTRRGQQCPGHGRGRRFL